RLAQKRAEKRQVEANLRKLEVGTRPEELAEQRDQVERAKAWRNLAKHDLAQQQLAFKEELKDLEELIAQRQAEHEFARNALSRARDLRGKRALADEVHE